MESFYSGETVGRVEELLWMHHRVLLWTARGSEDLLDYAKERIHALGLKGKIRVNKAGCLDACAHGPTMVIYPDDTWYSPKTKEDIEEIITGHIRNNCITDRLVIKFKKDH